MDTLEAVKDIVAGQVGSDAAAMTEATALEEVGYDSLDVLETIFALEEKFDIRIPFDANDAKVKGLRTIGDIARMVQQGLDQRASV